MEKQDQFGSPPLEKSTSEYEKDGHVAVAARNSIELGDQAALAACGYTQEFKREFSLFSTFSVSFSVLGILPSVASTLSYAIGYTGQVGLTWAWIIAFTGIQSVALSMAELSSSMPTSGGLYYVAAVLAPPAWAPFAAYIVGWSNWLGLMTGCPSVNYGNASMIVALAEIYNPDFEDTYAKRFGITVALTAACAVMTGLPTRWVARINSYGTPLQMCSLIVVIIGVLAADIERPKFNPNSLVWGTIQNGTDWPAGIAILQSFLTAIWTMSGYDAPFHLSEECSNSQIATPRAIWLTALLGGLFGWFLTLTIAYTLPDVGAALDSAQPFIGWLSQVVAPKMVLAFGSLTVICGFFCAQGCNISASRLAFAYARDGVLPFSSWVAKVNHRTVTPINAVIFNFIIQVACLCLIFAGPIAIGAIFSIGAVGAYFAFTVPIAIRCFCAGDRWKPGPWNLGRFSLPLGYFSCGYVALMLPILCFPAAKGADLTPQNFNWTIVCWGGPLSLAALWFAVQARKTFKGPKINLDHLDLPDGTRFTQAQLRELKTQEDVTALVRQVTNDRT